MTWSEEATKVTELNPAQAEEVRDHLQEILNSQWFAASKRAQDFLRLVVEHALAGEHELLRERMIGAEMFHRSVDYDTANDPVVRVKATEVRKKLGSYYLEHAGYARVRIQLPSGTYVPRFVFETARPQSPLFNPPSEEVKSVPGSLLPGSGNIGEEPADAQRPSGYPPSRFSTRTRFRILLIGGILALVTALACAAYLGLRAWRVYSSSRRGFRSIAILPFENVSGDPNQDYFADGMTEELIADLGRDSSLQVISKTSSMSYKGTKKRLPEIARELSVDGVVEGTVLRAGSEVRITAEFIDAKTDHPIWAESYVRDLTNVLTLQDELAQALADEVSIRMKPEQQLHPARPHVLNAQVEDSYLQGMFLRSKGDCNGALNFFQRAVQLDPNFARAHAGIAACFGALGEDGILDYHEAFTKQREEAAQAIKLDASLPDGHAELANAAMNLKFDWPTAATEFNKALQLNPSLAPIHERYAIYLLRTGNLTDAVAEAQRGLALDPISLLSFRSVAFTYYFTRQYDQALAINQKMLALNLISTDDSFLLGDVYAEKGAYQKSIEEFLKSGDSPHALGHLGNAYARAGKIQEARATITRLIHQVHKDGVGRYEIALVYAGLGDKDEAFAWLDDAYQTNSEGLTNLKIDPCLDPLRSDPRFARLLERTGLSN
jgi:TolB-like protein